MNNPTIFDAAKKAIAPRTIKLWRSSPVETEELTSVDSRGVPGNAVLASARQGLTEAVTHLGLHRTDYVGIPDYGSHCIIDFLGRKATPVPVRFLPPSSASAVLIYDQWGWQKSPVARAEVRKEFRDAKVIWDRVDSLPVSFQREAEAGESEAEVQVFSLKKTLTASGGGLVWLRGLKWLERNLDDDRDLVAALEQMVKNFGQSQRIDDKVQAFICNECDFHMRLQDWLQRFCIDDAADQEHQARRVRMESCARYMLAPTLPSWMRDQLENTDMPAPGIWPVRINTAQDHLLAEISRSFHFEARSYHFNFNDSYLNQHWTRVLGLPLHSELGLDLLEELLVYLRNMNDV